MVWSFFVIKNLRKQRDGLLAEVKATSQELTEARIQKQQFQAQVEASKEVQKTMGDSFRSLAAQALEGNNKQFMELAKSSLGQETELSKADLEKRQASIQNLVIPLKETLDRYQTLANELERNRQRSYQVSGK